MKKEKKQLLMREEAIVNEGFSNNFSLHYYTRILQFYVVGY